MSNEVINQTPTLERAKELEQQAKQGLDQLKLGQDKVIIACHKMRDTKAYKTLGFDSYYAWGESALNLKKSRLNELAVAGEVQQELLLTGIKKKEEAATAFDQVTEADNLVSLAEDSFSDNIEKDQTANLNEEPLPPTLNVPDLTEINTPQLIALAKAPKGERLAILDLATGEAKAEDKPLTNTIKEVIKASAKPFESIEQSAEQKATEIKKQHKSAMLKVSKLNETINVLDTAQVDSEEVESWKAYLDEIKQSIATLESNLGY
ncbi:MAG: hypothetical protein QM500_00120 [Methylococcales bacterium]